MVAIDLISTYFNLSNPIFHNKFFNCVETLSVEFPENIDDDFVREIPFWNSTEAAKKCLQMLVPKQLYRSPYVLPVWQQALWSTLFAFIIAVGCLGNGMVVWTVLAHRRMRTVTNYFLFNLAIADVSMSVFNTIFNFVYLLQSNWTFGGPYCMVNNFVSYVTVASSVFSISAMSIDRYFAIVHPLSPRMAKRKAVLLIALTWAGAALLALPSLLYSTTTSFRYGDGSLRTLCFLHWPDGQTGTSHSDYLYNIIFLLLTYVLPTLCMAFTYLSMCKVLWGSKSIGSVTERQKESVRSKQRVVRMLVTVVVIFVSCWLPYHVYFLYSYNNPQVNHTDYVQHVFLAIYLLAMSNSMVNPIIYYIMNRRFRGYFQALLCFCIHRDSSTFPNDQLRNNEKHSSLRLTLSTSISRFWNDPKEVKVKSNHTTKQSEV